MGNRVRGKQLSRLSNQAYVRLSKQSKCIAKWVLKLPEASAAVSCCSGSLIITELEQIGATDREKADTSDFRGGRQRRKAKQNATIRVKGRTCGG